jgi:hypothetical protein
MQSPHGQWEYYGFVEDSGKTFHFWRRIFANGEVRYAPTTFMQPPPSLASYGSLTCFIERDHIDTSPLLNTDEAFGLIKSAYRWQIHHAAWGKLFTPILIGGDMSQVAADEALARAVGMRDKHAVIVGKVISGVTPSIRTALAQRFKAWCAAIEPQADFLAATAA